MTLCPTFGLGECEDIFAHEEPEGWIDYKYGIHFDPHWTYREQKGEWRNKKKEETLSNRELRPPHGAADYFFEIQKYFAARACGSREKRLSLLRTAKAKGRHLRCSRMKYGFLP